MVLLLKLLKPRRRVCRIVPKVFHLSQLSKKAKWSNPLGISTLWRGQYILQMLLGKNTRRNTDIIRHFWIISKCVVGKWDFFKILTLRINEAFSPKLSSIQTLLSGSSLWSSESFCLWFANLSVRAGKVVSEMNTISALNIVFPHQGINRWGQRKRSWNVGQFKLRMTNKLYYG